MPLRGPTGENSMKRRHLLAAVAAASPGGTLGQTAEWPNRPIRAIVPYPPGGPNDIIARLYAPELTTALRQTVLVENRAGGSGVIGTDYAIKSPPDGYTLGIITVEISMMHWQGLTELTPRSYTPLALMNEDPPGIQVRADAPYKTVKDLADAIKAAPAGKLKASGTGQGGIWHLALVGWLQAMGLKPDHVAWVPSNGAAPAMQDLAAGGIDLVPCSVPEGRAMIEAGKAKSLAIMATQRNPTFPNVPTLKEEMGIDYATGAWRGFAAPKGLPADMTAKLTAALKKVYESKEYNDFMSSRGFGVKWVDGQGFAQFMDAGDAQMGVAMKAAGLAKA